MSKGLQGTAMEHYYKWEAPISYSMLQIHHKNRSYPVELRTVLLFVSTLSKDLILSDAGYLCVHAG